MMYATSDWHLGPKNILDFDKRLFNSIDEHDQFIIDNTNQLVGLKDTLYIVGDFTHRSRISALTYRRLIKCLDVHLIAGNHDDITVRKYSDVFTSVSYAKYIHYYNQKIYMHHYACRTWRASHRGAWHLYGHSHGKLPGYGKSMDVCIQLNDYKPFSFDQIKVLMDAVPTRCPDHTPIKDGSNTNGIESKPLTREECSRPPEE